MHILFYLQNQSVIRRDLSDSGAEGEEKSQTLIQKECSLALFLSLGYTPGLQYISCIRTDDTIPVVYETGFMVCHSPESIDGWP